MAKESLLLHVCCGPCSTHVLDVLSASFDVTGLFFNPNIHPPPEYAARLQAARRCFLEKGRDLREGPYEPRRWFERVRGLEDEPEGGGRCAACIRMRLEEAGRAAAAEGVALFATTLSISPHKDASLINRLGSEIGERLGIRFFEADFKKKNGYRESCRISRRLGLYRQNYCGCVYSMLARGRGPRRR